MTFCRLFILTISLLLQCTGETIQLLLTDDVPYPFWKLIHFEGVIVLDFLAWTRTFSWTLEFVLLVLELEFGFWNLVLFILDSDFGLLFGLGF